MIDLLKLVRGWVAWVWGICRNSEGRFGVLAGARKFS